MAEVLEDGYQFWGGPGWGEGGGGGAGSIPDRAEPHKGPGARGSLEGVRAQRGVLGQVCPREEGRGLKDRWLGGPCHAGSQCN